MLICRVCIFLFFSSSGSFGKLSVNIFKLWLLFSEMCDHSYFCETIPLSDKYFLVQVRGFLARKHVKEIRQDRLEQAAALKIQAVARWVPLFNLSMEIVVQTCKKTLFLQVNLSQSSKVTLGFRHWIYCQVSCCLDPVTISNKEKK